MSETQCFHWFDPGACNPMAPWDPKGPLYSHGIYLYSLGDSLPLQARRVGLKYLSRVGQQSEVCGGRGGTLVLSLLAHNTSLLDLRPAGQASFGFPAPNLPRLGQGWPGLASPRLARPT